MILKLFLMNNNDTIIGAKICWAQNLLFKHQFSSTDRITQTKLRELI